MSAIEAVRNAASRLASGTGLLVVFAVTVLNLLRRAFRTRTEEPELPGDFRTENPELADWLDNVIEQVVAFSNALTLGLPPAASTLLNIVLGLVLLVLGLVALDVFSRERPELDRSLLDGLPWRSLNLLAGAFGFLVVLVIGILVSTILSLIIPFIGFFIFFIVVFGIVAVLIYFPAAIAVDGKNVIDAVGDSYRLFKSFPLAAVGIVFFIFVLSFVQFLVTLALIFSVPPLAGAVTSTVLASVVWTVSIAVVAQGYVVTSDQLAEEQRREGRAESEHSGSPDAGGDSWTTDESSTRDKERTEDSTGGEDSWTDEESAAEEDSWTDEESATGEDSWTDEEDSWTDEDGTDEDGDPWKQ